MTECPLADQFWSADMLRLFREAGLPRREPAPGPTCGQGTAAADVMAPQITSPLRGVAYTIRMSKPNAIDLRAADSTSGLYWFADQGFLGRTSPGEGLAWSPARAGRYRVRVLDEAGRSDVRDVTVEVVP